MWKSSQTAYTPLHCVFAFWNLIGCSVWWCNNSSLTLTQMNTALWTDVFHMFGSVLNLVLIRRRVMFVLISVWWRPKDSETRVFWCLLSRLTVLQQEATVNVLARNTSTVNPPHTHTHTVYTGRTELLSVFCDPICNSSKNAAVCQKIRFAWLKIVSVNFWCQIIHVFLY